MQWCLYFCLFLVMPAGFPVGYAAAAPAYTHSVYAGANPAFASGKSRVRAHSLNATTYLLFSSADSRCLPSARLCSGHTFQNVLLSQRRDCPTVLLLTQPLSCCRLPGQEHLPPTEPLCTGLSAVVSSWFLHLSVIQICPAVGAVATDHSSASAIIIVSFLM